MRKFPWCAVALVVLAVPAGASAADWSDGGLLTDPAKQAQPLDAVVDGSGDAAFAWSGYFLEGSQPHMRRRPRSGALSSDVLLGTDSEDLNAYGNRDGDLLLVSSEPLGVPRNVLVRTGTVRSDPSGPEALFSGDDQHLVCAVRAAVGPGGRAIVVYGVAPPDPGTAGSADFNHCSLKMRVRPSRGAAFGPEVQLTDPARVEGVDAAFDDAGRAIVAWSQPSSTAIRAVRVDPDTGASAPQDVAVPGETPVLSIQPLLRVAPTGRALLVFASQRPGGRGIHVAAATGDTRAGFGDGQVLSGPAVLATNTGSELDAALGDDGTAAVVWRAGTNAAAKVQGAVVGPGQPLTSAATDTLSGAQARGPRVAVGAGRADVAWFRLVPGAGRSVEATSGRPGGFGRVTRISDAVVAARAPEVEVSDVGAAWFAWGERPIGPTQAVPTVLVSRKLTVTSGRFSRTLDVLRARTSAGENIGQFDVVPSNDDAMVAVVARQRPSDRAPDAREFWQLRTYGE